MFEEAIHKPYWMKQIEPGQYPKLHNDINCDVLIVGGGITGLSAAIQMQEAGLDCVIIEMSKVGYGTTGHSTGHLDNYYDQRYSHLIKDIGKEKARIVINSKKNAIDQIEKWNSRYDLGCKFKQIPAYFYCETSEDVGLVENEYEAAMKLGAEAHLVDDCPLPFKISKAVKFENQARFSPFVYVVNLAKAFEEAGGRIFESTRMLFFEDNDQKVDVQTSGGAVDAGVIVLAGHTSLTGKMSIQPRIFPKMSYVVAAKANKQIEDALYWDTAKPYHYLRIADDNEPDTYIIGGADHHTGAETDQRKKLQKLQNYLHEKLGQDIQVVHFWSNEYFEPADGLPYVGLVPGSDRVYTAAAYTGDGLSFGTCAGLLCADIVLGRNNPLAAILSPKRIKPVSSAHKTAKTITHVVEHFISDRLARFDDSTDDVPVDEGRILRVKGEKFAVYKDKDGELHSMSPICRHMGCLVHWNNAAKTWDCPCHGGRYSRFGKVISGPPRQPLKAKSLEAAQSKHRE